MISNVSRRLYQEYVLAHSVPHHFRTHYAITQPWKFGLAVGVFVVSSCLILETSLIWTYFAFAGTFLFIRLFVPRIMRMSPQVWDSEGIDNDDFVLALTWWPVWPIALWLTCIMAFTRPKKVIT